MKQSQSANYFSFARAAAIVATVGALALASSSAAVADDEVRYHDLTQDPASGLDYERVPSPRKAVLDQIRSQPEFVLSRDFPFGPHKAHGAPGVAIFDYDRDGDLDIYVTNGPGAPNSLFSNQLRETGHLTFQDVALQAGVEATDQDSTGVCFGDIDNDGDHDLMVLGGIDSNRLFENQGGGIFNDITVQAGVDGGVHSTSSCAMGDIDNDGLLDIAVANTHTDWNNVLALVVPFAFNEHNQLYRNQGGNTFSEVAGPAGLLNHAGFPPEAAGAAGLSWVISMVDYDSDGDADIFVADDQGANPLPQYGGFPVGFFHLFENDGTGHFTDVTVERSLQRPGSWMGAAFGDWNCDRRLDFFATNVGDYASAKLRVGRPTANGDLASQWYLQQGDGSFLNPGPGELAASVFGWSTSALDYDLDGDTDIVYFGGFDPGWFVDASNPGVLLSNEGCSASFEYDDEVFSESADHARRKIQGAAVGDLNGDGFVDIVSVSHFDIPSDLPLEQHAVTYGGPLDEEARFFESHFPTPNPEVFIWKGFEMDNGSLAVEINTGNRNRGLEVRTLGSVGITSRGTVNRDGIGAIVNLETRRGKSQTFPVLGGSSYASQDSLAVNFGLGRERYGTVDVLWPGGTRNRLYFVRAGERLVFPEIPCSYADDYPGGFRQYLGCVRHSVHELRAAGALDSHDAFRFLFSSVRAYFHHRRR